MITSITLFVVSAMGARAASRQSGYLPDDSGSQDDRLKIEEDFAEFAWLVNTS
jgi:hypothetical protein